MEKSTLLKIIGIVFASFLVLLVAAYFFYPEVNPEKHEEVVQKFEEDHKAADAPKDAPLTQATNQTDGNEAEIVMQDNTMNNTAAEEVAKIDSANIAEIARLEGVIDSLNGVIDDLEDEMISMQETQQEQLVQNSEDFKERIKSLLNLEEDDLAPILEKMSNQQLVNLYQGGGTIQREKILRALAPDKAAELMTEIM